MNYSKSANAPAAIDEQAACRESGLPYPIRLT